MSWLHLSILITLYLLFIDLQLCQVISKEDEDEDQACSRFNIFAYLYSMNRYVSNQEFDLGLTLSAKEVAVSQARYRDEDGNRTITYTLSHGFDINSCSTAQETCLLKNVDQGVIELSSIFFDFDFGIFSIQFVKDGKAVLPNQSTTGRLTPRQCYSDSKSFLYVNLSWCLCCWNTKKQCDYSEPVFPTWHPSELPSSSTQSSTKKQPTTTLTPATTTSITPTSALTNSTSSSITSTTTSTTSTSTTEATTLTSTTTSTTTYSSTTSSTTTSSSSTNTLTSTITTASTATITATDIPETTTIFPAHSESTLQTGSSFQTNISSTAHLTTLHTTSSKPLASSSHLTLTNQPTTTTSCVDNCETLEDLSTTDISPGNVDDVLNKTQQLLNSTAIEGNDIYYTSLILVNATKIQNLKRQEFRMISEIYDRLLDADETAFQESNSDDLGSTQRLLDSIASLFHNSPSNIQYLNGKNLGLFGDNLNCQLNTSYVSNGLADIGSNFMVLSDTTATGVVSNVDIRIPRESACKLQAKRAYFAIYRSNKFFLGNASELMEVDEAPSREASRCAVGQFMLDGRVLSASLEGDSGEISRSPDSNNPSTMAVIRFSKQNYQKPLHGKFGVSFFQTEVGWSSELCQVFDSNNRRYFESHCQHLTDFTLVINGMATDPALCDPVLHALGYLVCSASVASLAIILIFYLVRILCGGQLSKRAMHIIRLQTRRTDDPLGFLYILSLFCFFFVFGYFTDKKIAKGACTVIAGLSYVLLLCSIVMTLFQSLKVLSTFVYSTKLDTFLRRISALPVTLLCGIGIPVIICLICGLAQPNFFRREDNFCWIRPDYIIIGVVLPTSIVVFNGCICFVMILHRLFPTVFGSRGGIPKQLTRSKSVQRLKIITLILVQFSLGVPWVLQYLTLFSSNATVFHYFFTIVNGSQGVVLLCIFIFRLIQVRRARRSTMRSTKTSEAAWEEISSTSS